MTLLSNTAQFNQMNELCIFVTCPNRVEPLKSYQTLHKTPLEKLMVDCAGPWKAQVKTHSGEIADFTFHVCSTIDSCICWVELDTITSLSNKKVRQAVEKNWLQSKPRPGECG